MDSSPPRLNSSCWIITSSSRTSSGSGSASSTPMCEFSSSTSPMAAMRPWLLGTRVPSPSPVVPSSPVRVAICESRLAMGGSVDRGVDWSGTRAREPPCTPGAAMNTAVDFPVNVMPRPMPAAMAEALRARFRERFVTALAVREQHGRDESPFDVPPPEAVVFCESTEDVAFVVACAAGHRVPVIPYGAGSSLEGHLLAVQGGVSIDLSRMNRVLQLNPEDLTVRVQAGVTRMQLNREIKDSGLFFPIDPGADATLGGMSATRASGTNAVRYGTMRDNVLALTVVTASGEVIRTGTRARKSSAGYDLTRLLVGSEGTLGVITEITLKLHPLPESVAAAICFFGDAKAAVDTTIAIIQMGVPIARCELLDANAVRAVNAHDHLGLAERPMLLMEFHGSPAAVAEQTAVVQEIATEHGGA